MGEKHSKDDAGSRGLGGIMIAVLLLATSVRVASPNEKEKTYLPDVVVKAETVEAIAESALLLHMTRPVRG